MGINESNDLPADNFDAFDYVAPSTRPDRLPIWYWVVVALVLSALAYVVTIGVHQFVNRDVDQSSDSSLMIYTGHDQAPVVKKTSLSELPTWAQAIAVGTPAG